MILIAGATGSLGRKITLGLIARGEQVRALARRTSSYADLQRAGATVVFGDLSDRDSLESACHGVEAVITTASVSKTADDSVEHVDLQGNQNLIGAAHVSGVPHFVFVSVLGASAESPAPVFRAKAAAEQRLREGPMVFTILQPDAFMDVWFPMLVERPAFAGQAVTLVGESRRRHAFVVEQDVAAFAIAALRTPAARNATVPIGGPEAVTFRQVVRAYEQAAGRSFPIRTVAPGEPIPGVPEPVWGIAAALETYDSPISMEETSRQFDVVPTSLDSFARSRLAILNG